MASSTSYTPTPASKILLIPWDPESPMHIERMYQQRLACGWKAEQVESWREMQRSGKYTLQWVALDPTDPAYNSKISKHTAAYPLQSIPLLDTATTLGGSPRPTPTSIPYYTPFIPIGHISLNDSYETPGHVPSAPGLLFIATFWISPPLQGFGLGRAAMDEIEGMAAREPLNAKTLALSTVANEYEGKEERWRALGRKAPVLSNMDWYARRGYGVFREVERMWSERDPDGKEWWFKAVFMRKDVA